MTKHILLMLLLINKSFSFYNAELLSSKVVVTGHTGLLGTSLISKLKNAGFVNIIGLSTNEIDLRNQQATLKLFQEIKPDYIFHCAAKVGGIADNMTHPADFLLENLLIGASVLVAAKETKAKRLIFFSTACAYPKECPQPMHEEYVLDGKLEPTNEGYAIAKIACGMLAQKMNEQFGTEFLVCLTTNMYGIHDHFEKQNCHVIPALIKRLFEAKNKNLKEVIVWGTGKPVRDFMHADDVAEISMNLMFKQTVTGYINIGSGTGITIKEMIEKIKNIIGYQGELIFDESRPDGMPIRINSTEKMQTLGLSAQISLDQGLREVISHYQSNSKNML